ncbi:two-partner secretion domain-containing protein [Nitrogeniibacter aestuarii]|uniref:two-partner secretion domain-containing protein n=1 Tax=Nitrogeniibacter aestuarii TaxID=2815343 RepID=UPI001E37B7B6|nr:filamentous hemagglutinin N-terminal domain-containing protein [Nitrogeniibacter aestuarii]
MIKHLAIRSRSPLTFLRRIRRPVATAVLTTFVLSPYGALAGAVPDITAPAQHQADVSINAGVEVVNIAAPDANGLSHNKWQQFDVPTAGMVLNNATSAAASQLVGNIQANPNLGNTAASTILNEVTSNNPSSLLGPLEVAGQSARLIIANPNGITCDGCGFINTPHVTLTTGTPTLESNGLRHAVIGGKVAFTGTGLQDLAARLDVFSRYIDVAAPISMEGDLHLVGGRFDISQNFSGSTTSTSSPAPAPALPSGPSFGGLGAQESLPPDLTLSDIGKQSAGPWSDTPTLASIDIGQSVAAGTISLVSRGTRDRGLVAGANVSATEDLNIYASNFSQSAGTLNAARDMRFPTMSTVSRLVVGRNLTLGGTDGRVAAGGSIQVGEDIFALFMGYESGSLTNEGVIRAGGNAHVSSTMITNHGVIETGGDLKLVGQLENDGRITAGNDLSVRIKSNTGEIFATRDALVSGFGPVRAGRDLILTGTPLPYNFDSSQISDFFAGQDIYLTQSLVASVAYDAAPSVSIELIKSSVLEATPYQADIFNFNRLVANRDIVVLTNGQFTNGNALLAGRDIRIKATEVVNTPNITTKHEEHRYTGERLCIDGITTNCISPVHAPPSPEPYRGCITNYRGVCTADVDQLRTRADMAAGRDLIVDTQAFSNRGANVTAGRNIDIATNEFTNSDRSYGIDWQAQWSDAPLMQHSSATCTSNCSSAIDWSRSSSGHIHLGTLSSAIQAGGTFSVDSFPRSGTPTTQSNGSTAAGLPASPNPAPSSFINTGRISAENLLIRADTIRNGLDVRRDYYRRIGAPSLPPSVISLSRYANVPSLSPNPAAAYQPELLMQVVPPALASSQPFALSGAQELAAIRNALLATTGQAWILPGLTWDPVTGQSPEQQQQAILAANGASFAIEHGIAYGTPLSASQQAQLTAPVLWYTTAGGRLTPTIYLPEIWQQQLIQYEGGSLQGEVAIALQADRINNTGFVISDGLITIDANQLSNQKRNAYYYEKRKVKGGKLIIKGDTVQPGGFMQAAQWDLNADRIYSRSGDFIVTGSTAAETRQLTSAFEAQIRAELGDAFTYEVAKDRLKTKFKAKGGGLNIVAMVAAVVLSVVLTPAISAAIGSMAGATAGTMAGMTGASLTTAGLGNAVLTSAVTGTLSSAVGQSIATGRVDWGSAFKSGAVAGVTYGITNAPILEGGATINSLGQVSTAVSGNVSETFGFANPTDRLIASSARAVVNAGVSSAINGGSFIDALKSSFINDMSAYAANDIGSAFIGKEGSLGHMLTHGVLGAMSEAARGGDPTAGAIGGITAAALAQPLDDALGLQGDARNIALTAITMLAGGYAAEALGHDGVAAAGVAQNATVNNYLSHRQLTEAKDEMKACGSDEDCIVGVFAKWAETSEIQDKEGYLACMSSVEECRAYSLDLNTGVHALQDESLFELDGPASTYMARLVQMNVMVEATWAEATMQRYFSQGLDLSPEAAAALAAIASGGVPIKGAGRAQGATNSSSDYQAENINAKLALRAKLAGLQKAQSTAARTKLLPDGRVRYYSEEVPARTEGPTRGASFVTEYDPATGATRQWMESYDHTGSIIRVHPKSINGQPVESQHFPPTGAELESWK